MPLQEASRTFERRNVMNIACLIGDLSKLAHAAGKDQIAIGRILKHLHAGGKVCERPEDTTFNEALHMLKEMGLLRSYRKKSNKPRSYTAKGGLQKLVNTLT